jgi:hypothetical protein
MAILGLRHLYKLTERARVDKFVSIRFEKAANIHGSVVDSVTQLPLQQQYLDIAAKFDQSELQTRRWLLWRHQINSYLMDITS